MESLSKWLNECIQCLGYNFDRENNCNCFIKYGFLKSNPVGDFILIRISLF